MSHNGAASSNQLAFACGSLAGALAGGAVAAAVVAWTHSRLQTADSKAAVRSASVCPPASSSCKDTCATPCGGGEGKRCQETPSADAKPNTGNNSNDTSGAEAKPNIGNSSNDTNGVSASFGGEERPEEAPEACPGVSSDAAGKSSACAGCPNQKLCASGEARKPDPAVHDVKERLNAVKRKILVLSGKGGVGKSTVSAQLSFGFSQREMDVGLLDVDICGPSVPRMLGLLGQDVHQSSEGWSPVYVDDHLAVMSIGFMLANQDDAIIWRGPRKNGLIKQFLTDVNWGALDVLLIDTPPGTSDEHLSVVTYLQESSLDGAVIVTTPQEVSLMDVRKEVNFCRKVNLPIIGVIENMSGYVCPKCGHEEPIFAPSTGGARAMCESMGVPFLGSVPLDGRVAQAGDAGLPLFQINPDGPVSKCIDAVISAILEETDRSAAARQSEASAQ